MYLTIAILLYVGWAQIAVTVRRLHDLNYSGKWLWFAYGPAFMGIFLMIYAGGLDPETLAAVEDGNVPENDLLTYGSFLTIIGFVLSFGVMILCAKAGTVGDNRFGPDPLQQRRNARQYQGFGQDQSFGQGQSFGQTKSQDVSVTMVSMNRILGLNLRIVMRSSHSAMESLALMLMPQRTRKPT